MPFFETTRDNAVAETLIARLRATATRRWAIMEICGGPMHAIVQQRLATRVHDTVELLHDPQCPACVAPANHRALADRLTAIPNILFTSLGDPLRTPSHDRPGPTIRPGGGQTRTVYSPLDAVELAVRYPDRDVVFFSAGFETTAPANALAVWKVHQLGIRNFSLLVSHATVPPAMTAVLERRDIAVEGFLVPAHVCSVTGWMEYAPIAARYRVPIVVTGLEPVDLLEGLHLVVRQLEEGRHDVENQYIRSARHDGGPLARDLVVKVFQVADQSWDGIGVIPASGLALRAEFAAYDAARRFGLVDLRGGRGD